VFEKNEFASILSLLFPFLLLLTAGCNAATPSLPAEAPAEPAQVVAPPNASDSGFGEWAMEGYNPQRNRATSDNIEPPLSLQREVVIGGDTEFGSPVGVARDTLFVESERKLHAFDLTNGQERWNFDLAGFFISPAVAGDTVFVRAESDDNGYVLALSVDKGLKLWQFKFPAVGSAHNNLGGHVTSPVISEGLVLVGAAQAFHALDANTGRETWVFKTQEPVASSATIAGDIVYFTDFTHLYAVDLKRGEERWNFDYEDLTLLFAPVVHNDQVIITSQNKVYALDRHSGELLWNQTISTETLVPSAAAGKQIYVKSVNQLHALDQRTGEIIWTYEVTDFVSLPAVTQDQVYVITRAGGNGQLRALRPNSGEEIWQSDAIDLANAAPTIAGGQVYVRTTDGSVLAYD
jgi:outer membrane protein assembly factor BamB